MSLFKVLNKVGETVYQEICEESADVEAWIKKHFGSAPVPADHTVTMEGGDQDGKDQEGSDQQGGHAADQGQEAGGSAQEAGSAGGQENSSQEAGQGSQGQGEAGAGSEVREERPGEGQQGA